MFIGDAIRTIYIKICYIVGARLLYHLSHKVHKQGKAKQTSQLWIWRIPSIPDHGVQNNASEYRTINACAFYLDLVWTGCKNISRREVQSTDFILIDVCPVQHVFQPVHRQVTYVCACVGAKNIYLSLVVKIADLI